MPASGKWAVDQHPNRDQIIKAMASGHRLDSIRSALAPSISREALGRYRRKIVAPGLGIALQLYAPKGLAETPAKNSTAITQVAAADPILATMHAEAEQRNRWIGKAEADPEHNKGPNHQALYGHDRNRLQGHRLHAELVGALTKETAGPVTNIMIVNAEPQQVKTPTDVLDAEVVDVGSD